VTEYYNWNTFFVPRVEIPS